MSIVCPNCSAQAEAGSVFCDNCGFDLRNVQPAAPPAPVYTPPAPSGSVKCPSCGYDNVAGAAFCENCGFSLQGALAGGGAAGVAAGGAALGGAVAGGAVAGGGVVGGGVAPSFVPGRLVIQATNTSLPFPPGKSEIMIGREDPVSGIFPEVDLDPHGGQDSGVSREHAKLVAMGGQVYVEAKDTPNGSFLNKQKLVPGQRMPINPGDELRLGKLALIYYAS